jgi:peptide/nickel transport system substrate-binding protein
MENIPAEIPTPPKSKNKNNLVLYIILGVLVVALASVGYYFFQRQNTIEPGVVAQNNKELDSARILLIQPVTGIYPDNLNEAKDVAFNTNLFDGLTNLRNGKIEKALAESWVTVDQNTWRFNLRKNVKFSNGTPFTAKDVKFSIEQAIRNKYPIDAPLVGISTVNMIDDYTVEIKTSTPVPSLILHLNTVPVISMDHFQTKREDETAIGTGPYRLVSFDSQTTLVQDPTTRQNQEVTTNQTIVLTANESYFGEKPAIKNLTYRYLSSADVAKLTQKQIQDTYDIFDFNTIGLATASALVKADYNQVTAPRPTVRALFLNVGSQATKYVTNTRSNPLADKRVRKALHLGLDSDRILKDATLSGRPASQLITQAVFGYNSALKRPARNVVEAKRLLTEAGFPNGFGFTLDFPSNRVPEATSIARQLADLGVTVTFNPLARDPGIKKLFAKDFAVFYSAWASDYFDATSTINTALVTGGEQNYTNFSNKQIDDLAKQINTTQEPAEKLKLLESAMNLVMTEEYPWLPLYEEVDNYGVRKSLVFTPSADANVAGYDLGVR